MKLTILQFGTILALFLVNASYPQIWTKSENAVLKVSEEDEKSLYELKIQMIERMKLKANSSFPLAPELAEKDVYLILGISSFAAFILSITVFKQEIFTTLPLAFFAAGVLFTILAN